MLETLAGKIKWDRTEGGICLEIFPRLKWRSDFWDVAFFCLLLFVIGGRTYQAIQPHPRYSRIELISIAAVWAVWLWLQSSKLWKRVRAITLTLSPAMLTTQKSAFGIAGKVREFSTSKLHNLRFGWPTNVSRSNRDRPSELQIDEDYKTIILASGIADEEATALIARMMEVYSFPKYPPSDAAA